MEIENITNRNKYTKPKDIPEYSFFVDDYSGNLYYLLKHIDDSFSLLFFSNQGIYEPLGDGYSKEEAITERFSKCDRLRIIDSDDVKLTYKFKE